MLSLLEELLTRFSSSSIFAGSTRSKVKVYGNRKPSPCNPMQSLHQGGTGYAEMFHIHVSTILSMVGHSNHSSSSYMRTPTIDGRWLDIQTTNHSPSSNKCTLTIDGRWLDIQTTNHSPSSSMHTLTIDGWTFKPPTNHHRATCTL